MVSFQLAGELALSNTIVESWGPAGRIIAGLSLGLDYLFLFLYGSFLSLACVRLAGRFSEKNTLLSCWWVFFAWAAIGAALFDALENYALIRILLGTQLELWPTVAFWCAFLKFVLIALSLGYLVLGYPVLRIMMIRKG